MNQKHTLNFYALLPGIFPTLRWYHVPNVKFQRKHILSWTNTGYRIQVYKIQECNIATQDAKMGKNHNYFPFYRLEERRGQETKLTNFLMKTSWWGYRVASTWPNNSISEYKPLSYLSITGIPMVNQKITQSLTCNPFRLVATSGAWL